MEEEEGAHRAAHERELDLVQSQVFLEVEKNPFSYHNLLTLNFNTDLGSKWALNDGLFNYKDI